MAAEARQCPRCKNFDSLVPVPDPVNDTKWTELEGRRFGVQQLRCVACGLSDLVERDVARVSRAAPEPRPGEAVAGDGRMFVSHPMTDDPIEQE